MRSQVLEATCRTFFVHYPSRLELLSASSEESAREFVNLGGLRLLNRWLQNAAEEEHVDEMSLIIKTCKRLPFSSKHVKDSEIGKTIKRLAKYSSEEAPLSKIDSLKGDVESVMQLWIQKVQLEKSASTNARSKGVPDTAAPPPQIIFEISDLLVKQRGLPKAAAAAAAASAASAAASTAANAKAQPIKTEKVVPYKAAAAPTPAPATAKAEPQVMVASSTTPKAAPKVEPSAAPKAVSRDIPIKTVSSLLMASKMATKPAPAPILLAPLSGSADALSSPKAAESPSKEPSPLLPTAASDGAGSTNSGSVAASKAQERRMAQFAEAAKKTLLVLKEEEEAAPARLQFHEMGEDYSTTAVRLDLVPEKSCLKRASDGSDGDKNKKKRRVAVQWADEKGESLRDVCTFEVDKIRQSTSGYKNHKDLVRREKQFEKEMHVSGIDEAMQKTVEWARPELLKLSMEVVENSQNPVVSPENEAQSRRCAQVMEARYLDETLIPPDPDDPPFALDKHVLRAEIPSFPWDLPGSTPAAAATEQYFEPPVEMPLGGVPMSMGMGMGYNLSNLPPALLALDSDILQHVILDPTLVPSLLHENGTLNHSRVNVLRLSLMNAVPLPSQPLMQQPMMQQQPMYMQQQPLMKQQPMYMQQQPIYMQQQPMMQQQWQDPMMQQQMYAPNPLVPAPFAMAPFPNPGPVQAQATQGRNRNQNLCLAFASGKGCFRASCPYKP